MTTKPDDGPAFPRPYSQSGDALAGYDHLAFPGMSLRDWFAGQIVAGVIRELPLGSDHSASIARMAYALADAMLKARNP